MDHTSESRILELPNPHSHAHHPRPLDSWFPDNTLDGQVDTWTAMLRGLEVVIDW